MVPRRWGRVGCFSSVLGLEESEIIPHLGIVPVALQVITHLGSRIAEQRSMHEVDGCSSALDVQEDRANLLQLEWVRSGMYAGPMQSG